MSEPITIAGVVIGGLVSVYKAYTEYKAATAKAIEEKAPTPAKTAEIEKGAHTAEIIKASVQQHGEPKDVRVVESFEDDPDTYEEALQKTLARLSERSQPFAQQLRNLAAQQANIQTGGVQGSVDVSGEVYGAAVGVNTGTISGTYTINKGKKDQGKG